MEIGFLLGFVVSKYVICNYPLKIVAIVALPPPTDITKLQIFQGKENFLHHFVCNFAEKMHGYMHLLKKRTPFIWDDQDQWDFDNLKHAITHSPMSHPPNYSKDFLLYIDASTTTIGMVLVHEDSNGQEHVIYYLSKRIIEFETQYSHVEKLALAMVIVVQNFRHYILLCTTTILADQNPMYYIMTC